MIAEIFISATGFRKMKDKMGYSGNFRLLRLGKLVLADFCSNFEKDVLKSSTASTGFVIFC